MFLAILMRSLILKLQSMIGQIAGYMAHDAIHSHHARITPKTVLRIGYCGKIAFGLVTRKTYSRLLSW